VTETDDEHDEQVAAEVLRALGIADPESAARYVVAALNHGATLSDLGLEP